jgi:formylmethanofuran--tetrahydromethanopterin N-formyltransferase
MAEQPATVHGVVIDDTFAEAFGMRAARVIITAATPRWARQAATTMTGFATSVIACKCEAAIERELLPRLTPDGRPGISVLVFATDSDGLQKRLVERIGQTVLTCPTTACFDGLPDATERMSVGKPLRIFGDGFQSSKVVAGRRYWRIPVMEGEFLIQEDFGRAKAIGGGNFLIQGETAEATLAAAESAVEAMTGIVGVILPFPGGIVRSGSKIGAKRYKTMIASTNDAFAPTLRPITTTQLAEGVNSVLEIVLDGLDFESIAGAMRIGITAACRPGIRRITAGNYGGKLGPHHFHLRKILSGDRSPEPPPSPVAAPPSAAPATGTAPAPASATTPAAIPATAPATTPATTAATTAATAPVPTPAPKPTT